MKNIIKKWSAFIVAVLVIMSLMPVTAKAEDTYTLYARVPSGWEVPNVWAWTDAGVNVFDTWPGQVMNNTGDGEWYSIELPVSATNVIINYNGDSNKTGDIKVSGADVWITVCADKSVVIDYSKPTGAAPDSGNTDTGKMVNLIVTMPADWTYPYLWAWNDAGNNVYAKWPGEAMDIQENGTVTKLIPDWVTGLKISANGGAIQTDDILIESGVDVYITIYAKDDMIGEYKEVEEPTEPDMPPTELEDMTPPADDETTADSNNSGEEQNSTTAPNSGNSGNTGDNGNSGNSGDNGNSEDNNNGFFKFLIPAVCVVVIVVVISAVKKGSKSGYEE